MGEVVISRARRMLMIELLESASGNGLSMRRMAIRSINHTFNRNHNLDQTRSPLMDSISWMDCLSSLRLMNALSLPTEGMCLLLVFKRSSMDCGVVEKAYG